MFGPAKQKTAHVLSDAHSRFKLMLDLTNIVRDVLSERGAPHCTLPEEFCAALLRGPPSASDADFVDEGVPATPLYRSLARRTALCLLSGADPLGWLQPSSTFGFEEAPIDAGLQEGLHRHAQTA